MGLIFKALAVGAATIYGLTALGKKIDKSQASQFIAAVDRDIIALAKRAKLSLDPSLKCFSNPVKQGSLNKELISIRMSVKRQEGAYRREIVMTVLERSDKVDYSAMREYDSVDLPTDVVAEVIKSNNACFELLIYKA